MITDNPHADFDRHQAGRDAAEEAQGAALETLRYEMREHVEALKDLCQCFENDHGICDESLSINQAVRDLDEQTAIIAKTKES
jgi:hypothetical protein